MKFKLVSMMTVIGAILVMGLSVLSVACSGFSRNVTELDVAPQRLDTPVGTYFGYSWLSGDWIITNFDTDFLHTVVHKLWKFRLSEPVMQEITFPAEPDRCRWKSYGSWYALKDGRVVLLEECFKVLKDTNSGLNAKARRIMAWDISSEDLGIL